AGQSVIIRDEVVALVVVLQFDVLLDRPEIIADMELARRLHAAEDASWRLGSGHGSFVLCHLHWVLCTLCMVRDKGKLTHDQGPNHGRLARWPAPGARPTGRAALIQERETRGIVRGEKRRERRRGGTGGAGGTA